MSCSILKVITSILNCTQKKTGALAECQLLLDSIIPGANKKHEKMIFCLLIKNSYRICGMVSVKTSEFLYPGISLCRIIGQGESLKRREVTVQ